MQKNVQGNRQEEDQTTYFGGVVGGLAGFGYAQLTGALPILMAASEAQLASLSTFIFAPLLPLSVTLPVAIPVMSCAAAGVGIAKLYGLFSNTQNSQHQGQEENQQNHHHLHQP